MDVVVRQCSPWTLCCPQHAKARDAHKCRLVPCPCVHCDRFILFVCCSAPCMLRVLSALLGLASSFCSVCRSPVVPVYVWLVVKEQGGGRSYRGLCLTAKSLWWPSGICRIQESQMLPPLPWRLLVQHMLCTNTYAFTIQNFV